MQDYSKKDVVVSLDATQETAAPAADPAPKTARLTPAERMQRHRDKLKKKKQAKEYKFYSAVECTKTDAKRILAARILNDHVCECVYDLLQQAAEQLDITPNAFLFQNGVMAALSSLDAKAAQELPETSDERVIGELLTRSELYALYDASVAWREEINFDQFLAIRQNCKRDCFYLGKEILQKDFAQCHRTWTDFFPKFDPTTLPPNYAQKQAAVWLDSQSIKKNFLLMASRASFKSSWSHVWLLTAILCLPDVRILLISETRPLSKDFIGAIRSYFEVIAGQETRFQQLFPEFTIPMGSGSVLSLEVPMAHLRLPQSIESTSMDSSVAGRRFDIGVFDDPISSTSCGNETQVTASISKYYALKKLGEYFSIVATLGTPWDEHDLFAHLIARNEEDDDKPLAFRIDPAWTLKPDFALNEEGKPRGLREIKEHMVELLFPERLSWKFLQSELRANPAFFASQNLCIFPRDEDADARCTFDEIKLREHIKHASFFLSDPVSKIVLSVDTAFSTAMTADFSCLTTIKILRHDDKDCAVVWDVDMARWPYSDLAIHIVQAIDKHRPTEVVIEKQGPWQTLQLEIQKQAMYRNVVLPHLYWKEFSGGGASPRQKSTRVKALEPLLANDQLFFIMSHWTDQCLEQLRKFDGLTRSNAVRKDDFPDSLAIAVQTYFPYHDGRKVIAKTPEQEASEAAMLADAKRRETYKRYFGYEVVKAPEPVELDEPERNPLFRGNGAALRRR
jgi:hypothetical protein